MTWIRRIALLLGALVVALLLGELVVRVAFREPPGHHHRLFCEFDPELGWRKVPNGGGRHRTEEYEVEERFNSEGLRGPEFEIGKPPGAKRILLLGDSFVEGYTVPFEKTVGEVIRRETGVEVINGGTGGYSTDQELLFFLRDGQRYAPDVTILFFYVNDIWFNAQNRYWRGSKPLFRIAQDGSLVRTNPVLPPPDAGRSAASWFEKRSQLYRLASGVRRRLRTRKAAAPPFRFYRHEWNSELNAAWKLTVRLLGDLDRSVRESGSRFLVVHIPPNFRVHDDAPAPEGDDLGRVERELASACRDAGIELVLLRERMRKDGRRFYFEVDRHWNEAGHEFAGRIVAERVRRLLASR
ncbi:MAG: SGNH/GDSL hydrolase family protein [Planctomycetota bacterium]